MKRFFVGIDISKKWLDFAVWDKELNQIIEQDRVANKKQVILSMTKKFIREFGHESLWVCFEHTGNYGILLCVSLDQQMLPYSMVPALEIKQSQGIKRGKNDRIDARRIAEYAAIHSYKLKPTHTPTKIILRAKQLLTFREQLVKNRSSLKNSLKSHLLIDPIIEDDFVTNQIKQKIKGLDSEIKQVERKLIEILKEDSSTCQNLSLAQSVKGIGLITAATIIVLTKNFTAFTNPRKFNCYSGLAPFENSSGLSNKPSRTSMLRNKKMKTILMNAANSAIRADPQLKRYFQKKLLEGKNKMSVLNAVGCKLIYRVFAVVKRKSEYVILHN